MAKPSNRYVSSRIDVDHARIDTRGGSLVGRDQIRGDHVRGNKFEINAPNLFFTSDSSQSTDELRETFHHPPRLLPYLTDRTEQQRRIAVALQARLDHALSKPTTFFVHGSDDDCLDSFVDQVRYVRLPAILRSNALRPEILFLHLEWPNTTEDMAPQVLHLEDVQFQVRDVLGLKSSADNVAIVQKLSNNLATCFFHVGLSLNNWNQSQAGLVHSWLRWLNMLDLSKVQYPITILVSIVYPPGFWHKLMFRRHLAALRKDIGAFASDAALHGSIYDLTEMRRVRFDDVEKWIRDYVDDVDHEQLRRMVRKAFMNRFGFWQRTLSMYRAAEVVKIALMNLRAA
jgi:hypothetical protein